MKEQLRVLIVEDDEADAELTRMALEDGGFDLQWRRVDTAQDMRDALDAQEWDAVVSDFAMPNFDGLRAFSIYLERRLEIPFVFVSGALGEERAVEAMRVGAHDYHLKGQLGRLAVAMRRELRAARNRRQKTTAEESSRRHQRRLGLAVEASGVGIFESNMPPDDDTFVAGRCVELLGLTPLELPEPADLGVWIEGKIHPDDVEAVEAAWQAFVTQPDATLGVELRMRNQKGHYLDVDVRAKALSRDGQGGLTQLVGVVLDLTERKNLEAHLRQNQKMEAIGRLAGGVAHDFNNLLTAIYSFGSFVLDGLGEDNALRSDMEEVMKAAQRAAGLTNQLLSFSRLKKLSPRVTALRGVIVNVERMLTRLLGEDIAIITHFDPSELRVKIDPAEFEQVLVNLAVNARDAMIDGGTLTVETSRTTVHEPFAPGGPDSFVPGEYAIVAVTDTGSGMDPVTLQRIFEPFFTTKDVGRGTGLGLATCYAIIKQAGGFIWVHSQPGQGTTFKVFLPLCREASEHIEQRPVVTDLSGIGRVLVVEDDEQVRTLAVRTLERYGYTVTQAADGAQALAICASDPEPFALVLTDVVMPVLSGRDLADRLATLCPATRVLFMSGYAPNAVMHRGDLDEGTTMIQKPFTPETLAREVRAVLDADLGARVSVAPLGGQG